MAAHTITHTEGERIQPQTKKLWKVFWILLGITAVEFLIAFTISSDNDFGKWLKITIFIVLTLVKSFYIVGTFMHLKDEVLRMILMVVLPIVFLFWFIGALMAEGGYVGTERGVLEEKTEVKK
jgi:cytochrome c oxidase subunit IV